MFGLRSNNLWHRALFNKLTQMDEKLDALMDTGAQLMATIQEILDDETTETADLEALVGVVHSQQDTIAQQAQVIADLQANAGNLTPEQQAQLDAINAAQDANDATIRSLLPPVEPTP